ncbi:MAG: hypothetical protein COB36_11560 [Alphaproteobacteria bacterium]|nr:MAG: hypothetical protein COB36_11560 [Alphaproteobacteria bacterium]
MKHTKENYAAMIKALGLSQNQFSLHPLVCVSRGTISRHVSGDVDPIPERFWNALEWMDKGKVDMK